MSINNCQLKRHVEGHNSLLDCFIHSVDMLVSYDRKLALWEATQIQAYYETSSYIYFCGLSSAGLQIINVPLHVSLVFIAPCLAINFMILPVSLLTALIAVAHLVAMSQSKGYRERLGIIHI